MSVQVLANKHEKNSNFYEADNTLQQLLQQKLSPSFYTYANAQSLYLGNFVLDQLMPVKVTDREGEPN